MQNDKGDGRNIHYSGAFDDETGAMRASRLMWSEHVTRLASENLVLKRDLAAAQSYATTLAVSMHRQHYAEDSPNWQPLTDLVGLLTQIDNMYAGLRNDLEALKVENKRLVGLPLATLMAERDTLEGLLVEIDDISWKRDGMRVCDSEDNSGDYYQSLLLTNTLKRIRAGQSK